MKLTPIEPSRSSGDAPLGRVRSNGTLSFTAAAVRTYNLAPNERVTFAMDESDKKAEPGSKLFMMFTGGKGSATRKLSGGSGMRSVAIAGILNRVGLDYETYDLTYEITRQFEYEGTRVLELSLSEKKKRA